jgi:hypothetical protein
MCSKGLITEDEFRQIDTILLEKYRPLLGGLSAGQACVNLDNPCLLSDL